MKPVANSSPSAVAPESKPARPRRSPYRRAPGRPPTHGAAMLTRTLRGVPLDTIDQRSQVGVALRRVRDDLTHQIGEPTAAERILIEEVAKARVIAEAVGQYILRQESLVRADDPGELLPVVLQHSGLVANLTRMLHLLGLRRHQKAKTLHDFIAARQP